MSIIVNLARNLNKYLEMKRMSFRVIKKETIWKLGELPKVTVGTKIYICYKSRIWGYFIVSKVSSRSVFVNFWMFIIPAQKYEMEEDVLEFERFWIEEKIVNDFTFVATIEQVFSQASRLKKISEFKDALGVNLELAEEVMEEFLNE